MTRSRRLLRDLSWLSLGHGARALAYLLLTTAITRSLGPAGYGTVALFIAFGGAIAYLAGSWPFMALPILAPRGMPLGPMFRAAWRVALIGAAVTAVALLPTAWSILSQGALVLALLAGYALGTIGLTGLAAVFQTQERMRAIGLLQTGERAVALLAVMALVVTQGLTPRSAEAVLAASPLLVTVVVLGQIAGRAQLFAPGKTHSKDLVRAVGLLGVVTAGGYVVAWVDLVILALFRPNDDVGLYALAYQVFTVLLQLGGLWIVATLPHYSRQFAAAEKPGGAVLGERSLRLALVAWAAACGAVALGSLLLLPTVFGGDFRLSLGPLMVLLGSATILAPYFAAVSVLTAQQRFRELVGVTVVGVTINIVLDLALAPSVGYWGPAAATAVQNVVVTILATRFALGDDFAWRILAGAAFAVAAISIAAVSPQAPLSIGIVAVTTVAFAYRAVGHWLGGGVGSGRLTWWGSGRV